MRYDALYVAIHYSMLFLALYQTTVCGIALQFMIYLCIRFLCSTHAHISTLTHIYLIYLQYLYVFICAFIYICVYIFIYAQYIGYIVAYDINGLLQFSLLYYTKLCLIRLYFVQ